MRQAHGQHPMTFVVLRPEDPISATLRLRGDVAVLAVAGELDGHSAAAFKSAISGALARNPRGLVVDLSGASFLGTVGVSVLVEARQKVGGDDRFAVVAGEATAGRTIEVLDLADELSVRATVNEALDAMGSRYPDTAIDEQVGAPASRPESR